MTLKQDDRDDVVKYRLEKAKETLNEAQSVSSLGYWSLAANRLYYAAYYASVALLIANGIEASSHRGVIRMIGQNFINTGKLLPEDAKLIGRLFSMRQTGDYEDLFDWEENDIVPLLPRVQDFVSRIEKILY